MHICLCFLRSLRRDRPLRYRIEGPFDSSYSLALVNREMALALERLYPWDVALYSTEGGGDFPPDPSFLAGHPKVARLWKRGRGKRKPLGVSRLLYPPRVADMQGDINLLTAYGWEETGFPWNYVLEFNQYLDGITVMSRYVQKVLVDAGVSVPVVTTGLGADHILPVPPSACPLQPDGRFTFLHVSSCFPRKGVDLLLAAYFGSFNASDPVSLVIKTFPNPHNDVEHQLSLLHAEYPDGPMVVLINRDVEDGVLRSLYHVCHCLVAPGRGEGFGLPLAEAMLHGMPVITTGYGGQTDFCTDKTAWLIEYDFRYARTHMGQFDSVWAEPRVAHLAKQMREVYRLSRETPALLKERTEAAATLIRDQFNWDSCARRFDAAASGFRQQPVPEKSIRLGWVSSWNTRCGIASYSAFLLKCLDVSRFEPQVFASYSKELTVPDDHSVCRCWNNAFDPDNLELQQQIEMTGCTMVVIQFNFSFFSLANLARLCESLLARSVGVVLFLHAVADTSLDGQPVSLGTISDTLRRLDRVMVHNVAGMNILKGFDVVDNVTLFPQGVPGFEEIWQGSAKETVGLTGSRVIGAYGFMLPHKGLPELIEAFSLLRQTYHDLHLLLVNAWYSKYPSEGVYNCCQEFIQHFGLAGAVTMKTDYLEEEEAVRLLAACDLIVYPYQSTLESSSAAVRMGLASYRPVACTPLDIFSDVRSIVHTLPGTTPELMAEGISELLAGGSSTLGSNEQLRREWLLQHDWNRLGERLSNLLYSLQRVRAAV